MPLPPNTTRGLGGYAPGIETAIFDFQREAYPHRRVDLIVPRWRWMFVESAQRLGVKPMIWVYRDNNRITAHQGAIPVRLQVCGEEHTTGWFVETMVLESVRGKTVGPAVVMKAKQDLPFNISLGQTPQMRELQFRLGWRQITPLKTFILPINVNAVFRQKIPTPILRQSLAAAVKIRTGLKRAVSRRTAMVKAERIDTFDGRHDALWHSVCDEYACAVVRDASYLNWKYTVQPGQDFIRLEFSARGHLIGVAVLSCRDADSLYHYTRAFIVDMVVSSQDANALAAMLDSIVHESARLGIDALGVHIHSPRIEAAIQNFGFIRRESTRFLLVSPGHESNTVNEAISTPGNWLLTMGDSDIDRPW